jgi:PAS domain S-box-containing protein
MHKSQLNSIALEVREVHRLLVDHMKTCAIYMLTSEGLIRSWCEGKDKIYGFSEQEVIGTHFSRFFCETERADQLPMTALKIAAGRGHCELFGGRIRRDGTCFQSYASICPILSQSGGLLGFGKVACAVPTASKICQILSLTNDVARLFGKAWGDVPANPER